MSKDTDVTIFIGNGLGMALDPNHFCLKNILKKEWKKLEKSKEKTGKNFVNYCKEINNDKLPENEEELGKLHLFFEGIRNIELVKNKDIKGIQNDLFEHLICYEDMIFQITKHFFDFDIQIKKEKYKNEFIPFMQRMKEFIRDNHKKGIKTHVITTNYDKLLYASFCDEKDENLKVFKNTFAKSLLIDGFYKKNNKVVEEKRRSELENAQFEIGNFYAPYQQNKLRCGSYLAIHGSPLFYSDEYGDVCKLKRNEMSKTEIEFLKEVIKERKGKFGHHLILCSPKQKMQTILASPLLQSYFQVFQHCVRHSNKIIVIGYSGLDIHIMNVFRNAVARKCEIKVVNYEKDREAEQHWKKELNLSSDNYKGEESILNYEFDDDI